MINKKHTKLPYKITRDLGIFYKMYDISPQLLKIMQDVYIEVEHNEPGVIEKLEQLILQYPANPNFKNFLSIIYNELNEMEKAFEVNEKLLEAHPEFVFGRINKATYYYRKEEYERMPEFLGPDLDIKALFPDRDIFHEDEIFGFYKVVILYLTMTGNIFEALARFEILEQINPWHPMLKSLSSFLLSEGLKNIFENNNNMEASDNFPTVSATRKFIPSLSRQPPVFQHPEVEQLYYYDIEELAEKPEIIKSLLALPRASLIEDLETILNDSMKRFYFFYETDDNDYEGDIDFVIHALLLLSELKATESLPAVLNVLRQDEEYISFFLEENLLFDDHLWEIIYHLGKEKLDVLQDFIKEPDNYTYSRSEVCKAVSQVALHQPEKRQEVLNWFEGILDFFLEHAEDETIMDTYLNGFIIDYLVDLQAIELENKIERLYKAGIVATTITGDWEDVQEDLGGPNEFDPEEPLHDIFTFYTELVDLYDEDDFDFDDNFDDDEFGEADYDYEPLFIEPVRSGPKIGRNDPCPCGSGKKYKKCCLNKD